MGKLKRFALIGIPALFILIQAVPYGRLHDDPPIVREPRWNASETRALAKRACFECHSNETYWPRYASIAPLSWLIRYDVAAAREKMNFSDWRDGAREGERPEVIRKAIAEGDMPHWIYRLMHPNARLEETEMNRLLDGLVATAAAGRTIHR